MRKALLLLLLASALTAQAHDYFLLPEKFFLKKGENIVCRLFVGDDFTVELEERPIHKYIITAFNWTTPSVTKGGGSRTYDLLEEAKDSTMPVLRQKVIKDGLGLLSMNRTYARLSFTPEKFKAYLKLEHLDDVLQKFESQPRPSTDSIREKYTRYIKTLFTVGTPTGEVYKERLGQTLEIVLLQNPYTVKRGGMITAQVFFRDAPLVNGSAEALSKDKRGKVTKRLIKTDANGRISFRLDEAGTWMVRLTHMVPSADSDADWESFWASYTFGVR